MGQDFWDARRWQREFDTKHVCSEISIEDVLAYAFCHFVGFFHLFVFESTDVVYLFWLFCFLLHMHPYLSIISSFL